MVTNNTQGLPMQRLRVHTKSSKHAPWMRAELLNVSIENLIKHIEDPNNWVDAVYNDSGESRLMLPTGDYVYGIRLGNGQEWLSDAKNWHTMDRPVLSLCEHPEQCKHHHVVPYDRIPLETKQHGPDFSLATATKFERAEVIRTVSVFCLECHAVIVLVPRVQS